MVVVDLSAGTDVAELEAAGLGTFCPDELLLVGAKKAETPLATRVARLCSTC
jgi:hypothetical protein